MSDLCSNAATRDKHEIPAGGRRIGVTFTIRWGDNDLRDNADKSAAFCSFQCLADYATDRARAHDGVVLEEGA